MRLGSLTVVVLSGYSTIRQALVRQGEAFAGRPDLFTFSAVANGTSMTFSEKYGPAWMLHKKLCKNALRSFSQAEPRGSGATCLLEEQVCAEAAEMVEVIREQAAAGDKAGVDPVMPLVTSVANVVCALCFGKRYDYNDKEFLTIVHINNEVLRIFAAGNLADFFPVFRYVPSPSLRKMVQHIRRMNGFMERSIEEHISSFDKVRRLLFRCTVYNFFCERSLNENKTKDIRSSGSCLQLNNILPNRTDTILHKLGHVVK